MSTNSQLQKISPPKIRRIRYRNRLVAASRRLQGRQPALDNFLIREAARADASPLRLVLDAIAAGGSGYSVGDQFNITGGSFSVAAIGMITAVSAGVVTAAKIIDGGQYTVVTPPASPTTVIRAKNGSGAPGTGLTVNDSLTAAVTGVTEAELLAAIEGIGTSSLHRNIGNTFDIQVDGNYLRNPRQSSQTYLDAGVPIV